MQNKLRGYVRPVLALLLVGIIVGLIFLYNSEGDGGNVRAETLTPNINSEPTHGTDGESEEVPLPKSSVPRQAKDGVLDIGGVGDEVIDIIDFSRGNIILMNVKASDDFKSDGIGIAYIESDSLNRVYNIEGATYLDSIVTPKGLYVAVRKGDDSHIYNIDYDFNMDMIYEVHGVVDTKLLLDNGIRLGYRQGAKYMISDMSNSILSIDNTSSIVAVFDRVKGGYSLVFEDGKVYDMQSNKVASTHNVADKIIDIEPIIFEGNGAYACIVEDEKNIRQMLVLSRDFNELSRAETTSDSVLFVDRIYGKGAGFIEVYCSCGEYLNRISSDIDKVTYIDYKDNMVYYNTKDNLSFKATFSKGKIEASITLYEVNYIDKDMTIAREKGKVKVLFDVTKSTK